MLALAKYSLKGPYHAASVVGILTIVAVFLPLLTGQSFVTLMAITVLIGMASALVGLIILTQGSVSGLKAIIVSIFGITLVTTISLNAPTFGLEIGLALWLPIVILAQTLKTTRSLAFMILAGLVLAIAAIAIQFLIWPELEATILPIFQQSLAGLTENPAISSEMLEEITQLLAHRMVLLLVPTMYLMFVGIMLLSRSMQAKISNSDGYAQEFQSMALGKPAVLVAVVIMILSVWLDKDWITSMALSVMAAFLYQGIAIVHCKLAANKQKALIIGIYYASLIIINPYIAAVSSIAGMIDNWLIFRKNRNIKST